MGTVKWTKGNGAIRPKHHFVTFKNSHGPAASAMPSWAWLCKHVENTTILVRWWAGKDGRCGSWDEHHFGATEIKEAKAMAMKVAQEYGWGARVYGRGWAFDGHGMGLVTIYEFGDVSAVKER